MEPDDEVIRSIFGTEAVAELDRGEIRVGGRRDDLDLTFIISDREAAVLGRRLLRLAGESEDDDGTR